MATTSTIHIENMSGDHTAETQPLVADSVDHDTSAQTVPPVETVTSFTLPFTFDTGHKGDNMTQRVAEILQLPIVPDWFVTDTFENLALVHYNDDADMAVYGHLRGVLVDTEVGAVISPSFGNTPTAVASELTSVNDIVTIRDQKGLAHNFSLADPDVSMKRVHEGVVIRDIWHKGRRLRITHRKIQPLRSRWGNSPYFLSMYDEAGGPTDDQLFDVTKPFSTSCYVFLVSHPALLVGTRQKVNRPYLVLLAHHQVDIKRPVDQVAPGVALFTTSSVIGGSVNEPFIHNPPSLGLDAANHHLKFGYYNEFQAEDPRQLTGEAVIIYKMTNGQVSDIVKVHSPGYEWRLNMRGNNPNVVHQFYSLLNKAYPLINTDAAWDSFRHDLIILPLYDEQSLKDLYNVGQAILTIPSGETQRSDYSDRDARIHLLWINYILSLPACVQGRALNILSDFKRDRNDLISWLQQIEKTTPNIETTEHPDRIKGIVSSSRRLARSRIAAGSNYSAKGQYMNLDLVIRSTIRNLINKENGPSLHSLVKEMKSATQAPPAAAAPATVPSV